MEIEKREYWNRVEWGYWEGDEFILHREGGPAIERNTGSMFWYYHGKLHREDGPARELSDGAKSWWYHGHEAKNEKEFYNKEWRNKILLALVK